MFIQELEKLAALMTEYTIPRPNESSCHVIDSDLKFNFLYHVCHSSSRKMIVTVTVTVGEASKRITPPLLQIM